MLSWPYAGFYRGLVISNLGENGRHPARKADAGNGQAEMKPKYKLTAEGAMALILAALVVVVLAYMYWPVLVAVFEVAWLW